jgi:glutaredoxin-related protein
MKKILRTLMVKFEERDVFMSYFYQHEIRDRMQCFDIVVPQLFVDGQYIGVSCNNFANAYKINSIERMSIKFFISLFILFIRMSIMLSDLMSLAS